MEYKELECPNCGAPLKADGNAKQIRCEYCDTVLTVEKNGMLDAEEAEKAGYAFEKGRQKARAEDENGNYGYPDSQKDRRFLPLWVLGWIFCFPIPLTVLIVRSKTLSPTLKVILVALLWIFIFAVSYFNNDESAGNAVSTLIHSALI